MRRRVAPHSKIGGGAHKRGIKVTGHLCAVTYKEAAELGIDDLEHGFFVNTQLDPDKKPDECSKGGGTPTLEKMDPGGPEAKDLIDTLVKHKVAITSTLPVFEGDIPGRQPLREAVLDAMDKVSPSDDNAAAAANILKLMAGMISVQVDELRKKGHNL